MTMAERAAAFARAFPGRQASWPTVGREQGRDVLYATWLIGQDYRNRGQLYGAYPAGYLPRVVALFPDIVWPTLEVLHAFSGSLPAGPYQRLDLVARTDDHADFHRGSVYDAAAIFGSPRFSLIMADPPYSKVDATRYGTPSVDRRRAIASLADVAHPGAHLVWLDTVWPMHSKRDWLTVGRITLIRSTNHRVRLISIFERVARA